jgi:hypothetical protein
MTEKLILVGCGSVKREEKSYSWNLYESDYFQKKMTLAMLMGHPAILSSKHGVVPVNKRIEPYEDNLREKEKYERDSWALQCANDIPDFYDEIVVLAGKTYRNPLQKMLRQKGFTVYSPFESDDIRGNGDQISWCKNKANDIATGNESVLGSPI